MFIQARVCRTRPRGNGESDASAVSEALPFLEFDLARQLMLKLKIIGRNAGNITRFTRYLSYLISVLTLFGGGCYYSIFIE